MAPPNSTSVLLRYQGAPAKQWFEAQFGADFSIRAFDSDDSLRRHLALSSASPAALIITGFESAGAINPKLLTEARERHPGILRMLISERIALADLMALLDSQLIDRCFESPLDINLIRSHILASALTCSVPRQASGAECVQYSCSQAKPTVLIVDDEPAATKYLVRQLEHMQNEFALCSAASAEEALDLLRAADCSIAVVMTDQRMPGMQGKELLDELRQAHPAIVRVLTSAWGEVDVAINAVNDGRIFRYQKKPWQARSLLTLFRDAIKHHRELAHALTNTRSESRKRFAELRLLRRERILEQLGPALSQRVSATTAHSFLDAIASVDHIPATQAHLRASEKTPLESELAMQFCKLVRQHLESLEPPGDSAAEPATLSVLMSLSTEDNERAAGHTGSPTYIMGQAINRLLGASGLDKGNLDIEELPGKIRITTRPPLSMLSHLLAPLTRLSSPLLEQQAALLMLFVCTTLLGGQLDTKAEGQSLQVSIELPCSGGPAP